MILALGNIAHDTHEIAVGRQRADDLCGESRSVLSAEQPLPAVVDASSDRIYRRLDVRHFRSVDDVGGIEPDQLVARIAEHLAHRSIGIQINTVGIGDDDAFRSAVE